MPIDLDTAAVMVELMRPPEYMTKDEAARRARVSVRTIERAMHDGELRYVGGRGFRRTRREWVDEWLERRGAG